MLLNDFILRFSTRFLHFCIASEKLGFGVGVGVKVTVRLVVDIRQEGLTANVCRYRLADELVSLITPISVRGKGQEESDLGGLGWSVERVDADDLLVSCDLNEHERTPRHTQRHAQIHRCKHTGLHLIHDLLFFPISTIESPVS